MGAMSDHHEHEADWQRWVMDRIRERPERIDVHVSFPGLAELAALVLKGFKELKQEIKTMSGTLSEQIAAAQADTNAKLDAIGTDVGEISADVDQLLAGMNPGDPVTQAMVDAAVGIQNRVSGIKDALDAVNAKVVPPVQP